jgi:hypothetical protein
VLQSRDLQHRLKTAFAESGEVSWGLAQFRMGIVLVQLDSLNSEAVLQSEDSLMHLEVWISVPLDSPRSARLAAGVTPVLILSPAQRL